MTFFNKVFSCFSAVFFILFTIVQKPSAGTTKVRNEVIPAIYASGSCKNRIIDAILMATHNQ